MQIQKKLNATVIATANGETHVEVFTQLAKLQEVFAEQSCGKCTNEELTFTVRKASSGKKEFSYYELRCANPKCRAKLTYGHGEGDILYPKRFKSEDGQYLRDDNDKLIPLGTNGWLKYNHETKEEE